MNAQTESSKNLLPVGRTAAVEVPATSANLGPGFDSLGLALDWSDCSSAKVVEQGLTFDLSGDGVDSLPRDKNHLIVRTILETLAQWNMGVPGLHLKSHSTIPLGRGLGSSSAAIVAGILLAWGLARPGEELDLDWAFRHAYQLEGHGDNVGPAIMGGFTITWPSSDPTKKGQPLIRTSPVDTEVRALALVPSSELLTESARAALPSMVPMIDAISNTARTALLVHALADDPSLLLEATADRLHQNYRSSLAPTSHVVMNELRRKRFAAFISGAGPTVLVLHAKEQSDELLQVANPLASQYGMTLHMLRPGAGARILH